MRDPKKRLTLEDADLPVEVAAPDLFFLFLLVGFWLSLLGCLDFGVRCLVCCSPFPGSLRLFGVLLFLLLDRRTAVQKRTGALQFRRNLSSILALSRTGDVEEGRLLV